MSQEIEIEFKQRLNQFTYERLMDHYKQDRSPVFHQVNHYFETPDYLLKSHGSALRVRETNGQLTLTFKQPHSEGLLETHESLSEETFTAFKNSGNLPDGEVKAQIQSLLKTADLPKLVYFGSLATDRSEIALDEGLLVLDRSTYVGITDYELEFESSNYEQGRNFFDELLRSLRLTPDEPSNKIRRFFEAKAKRSERG